MKNLKQDRLFQQVRQTPVELSHTKVESMIKSFPMVPPSTTQPPSNWTHLFSLNNLIMISIPIVLVATLIMSTTSNDDHLSANFVNDLSTEITNHEVPVLQYSVAEVVAEEPAKPVVSKIEKKVNNKKPTIFATPLTANSEKIERITPEVTANTQIHPTPLQSKLSNEIVVIDTIIQPKEKSVPVKTTPSDIVSTHDLDIAVSVPEAGVKVELKSNLEAKVFLDGEGFLAYAKRILKTSEIKPGMKSLFPVNLKANILLVLHEELYTQLLKDNLIQSKSDNVFIQLPRNTIAVNGKKLHVTLLTKYDNIIEAYKIRPGGRRGILLSENKIAVGDFAQNDIRICSANILK